MRKQESLEAALIRTADVANCAGVVIREELLHRIGHRFGRIKSAIFAVAEQLVMRDSNDLISRIGANIFDFEAGMGGMNFAEVLELGRTLSKFDREEIRSSTQIELFGSGVRRPLAFPAV